MTAPKFRNALAHETSPYLLQHAHNPVDWLPWGEAAFRRAREEDKPIFLSIGYAACHWCHVMERESFENEETAAFLNEHFVSIKVDREERPDVDDIYMNAVVAQSGSGGWPMSVFLTPDLKPFYGGTYYPPQDMYGRPGFPTLLRALADAWKNRRGEVVRSADGMTDYLQEQMGQTGGPGAIDASLLAGAVKALRDRFDPLHGGWGQAPKFPSSASIALLLREYQRSGEADLLRMATLTLDRMARGGIYDHLGGGFARYSVDSQWLVPHFEKMLYDNAQLSQVYLEAYQLTRNPFYAQIVREILDYELRDMRDPGGAFHSTEDADSEGQEGKFYVWTKEEIDALLGEDAPLFSTYYSVRSEGNFASHEPYHHGQNILHVTRPASEVAQEFGLPPDAFESRLDSSRRKLFEERSRRVRPGLDDKVLTAWNALLISALAQASRVLREPRYRDAALEAGEFLRTAMYRDGELLRTHRHGASRLPGYLDDYAFTVNAFVDVYEASFELNWLETAAHLAERMIERFWDKEHGGFYYTAEEHSHLLVRTKPKQDGAEPSGASVAAEALLRLAHLFGRDDFAECARITLEQNVSAMARFPQAFPRMLCAVNLLIHGPIEIALVGAKEAADTNAMLQTLYERFVPNKVVALLDPEAEGAPQAAANIPLLASRSMLEGEATAYVCRDFVCERPVNAPSALAEKLDGEARER